ncbi:MAG: phospholipase D-like domain-containing protein [Waddliaceae bacterium]
MSRYKYRLSWGVTYLVLIFLIAWFSSTLLPQSLPAKEAPSLFLSSQTKDDLKRHHVTAIESSKESIFLLIYSLKDPKIISCLRKKAEEGLDVTVICDSKASKGVNQTLGPKVQTHPIKGKGIMHQKTLVIDQKHVLLGSANMTTDGLRNQGNLVHSFYSEPLAKCIHSRGKNIYNKTPSPSREHFNIGSQKVTLCHLPEDTLALDSIIKMIASAKKSIRVAMFTWTREDLACAVTEAHQKGIDVQVVIDRNSASGSSARVYRELKSKGVPVQTSQGNHLHHYKFCYIDDDTLVNGSANWTTSAFKKNHDCILIFKGLTNAQKKKMDALWKTIWVP